jgi:hypothetical protein
MAPWKFMGEEFGIKGSPMEHLKRPIIEICENCPRLG